MLAALWSVVFLGALDGKLLRRFVTTGHSYIFVIAGTIIATLLSPIGAHFNRSNQSTYVGTACLLYICLFTPLHGKLSGILGHEGAMLRLGISLCGIAPSTNVLAVARDRGHGRRRVSTSISRLSLLISMLSFLFAES